MYFKISFLPFSYFKDGQAPTINLIFQDWPVLLLNLNQQHRLIHETTPLSIRFVLCQQQLTAINYKHLFYASNDTPRPAFNGLC